MSRSVDEERTKLSGGVPVPSSKFYCKSRLRQYFSACVVNLGSASVGTAWSWTSTGIPDINENADFGPLSSIQESCISSSVFVCNFDYSQILLLEYGNTETNPQRNSPLGNSSLGAFFACPIAGLLMHKFGPRASMLLLTPPILVGWIVMTFSTNFWMLLIGRFVTGFSAGGVAVAAPAFIAETSEIEIRGRLGFTFDIMGGFGQLFIFIIGAFVSWRWQAISCGCIPLICFLLLMFIPESPGYLISQKKMEAARKSLAWFRHAPSLNLIEDEFKDMVETKTLLAQTKRRYTDYFVYPILFPTAIGIALVFFPEAGGIVAVLTYTVKIFQNAGFESGFLATILVGITQLVVATVAAFFVDHAGRRVLLMLSAAFMAISMAAMGCYLHWQYAFGTEWHWLPVLFLILYITGFSIGFGPIPWVVMGEIVPSSAQGFSSGIVMLGSRLFAFLASFLYNDSVDLLGESGSYFLFASVSVVGGIFVCAFLPETMGMSLGQIQKHFIRTSSRSNYLSIR